MTTNVIYNCGFGRDDCVDFDRLVAEVRQKLEEYKLLERFGKETFDVSPSEAWISIDDEVSNSTASVTNELDDLLNAGIKTGISVMSEAYGERMEYFVGAERLRTEAEAIADQLLLHCDDLSEAKREELINALLRSKV